MSILTKIRQKLFTLLKTKFSNILLIIGLCVISFGISQFSVPLGIIFAGSALIFLAYLLS